MGPLSDKLPASQHARATVIWTAIRDTLIKSDAMVARQLEIQSNYDAYAWINSCAVPSMLYSAMMRFRLQIPIFKPVSNLCSCGLQFSTAMDLLHHTISCSKRNGEYTVKFRHDSVKLWPQNGSPSRILFPARTAGV